MAETHHLAQATAQQLVDAQKAGTIIIDIRREDEWHSTGIIPGAETITGFTETGQLHPDFLELFGKTVSATDAEILIYCRSGQRTTSLGNALISQLGYSQVSHLTGGIMSWMRSGYETTSYQP